jgi:carboxyl-terminal processing protease
MQNFLKIKNSIVTVVLVLGFFILGIYVGFHKHAETIKAAGTTIDGSQVDLSSFWKVWNAIDEKYPGAANVTEQERIYGAISGLVDSLEDPYSVFFTPDEAKSFKEDISGSFSGIGMEVGLKDKILTVIAPLKDTPAYRAGIKPGDKVLKINGTSTDGMSVEAAVKLIRGEKGTPVTLYILHEEERIPIELTIVRDTINIPTLDSELRSDGVFVIKLYSFSANSTGLFRNAMKQFAASKSDKLVLDLRGNPGGYLSAAVDISSYFLPSGTTIVTEDYGTDEKPKVFRSKGLATIGAGLKFVILINEGSASASEIVAGALKDHDRAVLVGTQSYGKGSVQEVVDVTKDTLLKITVAKWLTPDGISISEKGLTPDHVVEFTKEDAQAKRDPQMDKAVQLLKNWKK